MRAFSAVFLLVVPAYAAGNGFDVEKAFKEFELRFARTYQSVEERLHRLKVFAGNLELIANENTKGNSYTLGVTQFADLSYEEWRQQSLPTMGCRQNAFAGLPKLGVHRAPPNASLAESKDWVADGAVTGVKNQARCGSCWSFSTTGALEGAAFIAGRGLVSLSEENILDCDKNDMKCNGGSMDVAFDFVKDSGVCAEADYPYVCADPKAEKCTNSKCKSDCRKVLQAGDVIGHTDVEQTEGALESAVLQQPVSVAIEADKAAFQLYTGGVITSNACGSNLDHGVLAVGFGVLNGTKYWKVKNSWGASWGENGYVKIQRGKDVPGGECGIRKGAVYPSVKARHGATDIVV